MMFLLRLLTLTGSLAVGRASFVSEQLEQLYCGQLDCYELIGVDPKANIQEIRKAYRKLSLKAHPDRSDDPLASKRYVKITKAYEVLNNVEVRSAYDYYRSHPNDYYALYFGLRANYPQKTSPFIVIFLLLSFGSFAQYLIVTFQKTQLRKTIIGSPQFQKLVASELKEMYGSKFKKLSSEEQEKEKSKVESSVLLKRVKVDDGVAELGDNFDFTSLLCCRAIFLPYHLLTFLLFRARWVWKFGIMGDPLGTEEKAYLTYKRQGLNQNAWEKLSENEQTQLLQLELWNDEKFKAYSENKAEEERLKKISSSKYRQWRRWRKKNPDTSYMMED